jgi:metallo-beta-lactamase family protein
LRAGAKGNPSLQFLGAAGGVTGSKFLVTFGTEQILLDCGLFQGLKEMRLRNWAPPPFKSEKLLGVVLTHAHIDHSGYLPRLVARGFKGPVYATPATCDLLKIMLLDAAHLQEEEARFANTQGYSKHKPALPLYTTEDAGRALQLLRPTKVGEEVEVGAGMSLWFSRVGHILGAAAARVSFDSSNRRTSLVDSGDLGRYGRPILKDPEPVQDADWLMVESTYGDRTHQPNPESALAQIINQVADEAGCLLIPAFAVGRTQELIYSIRKLEEEGKIPALPLHVDSPMAINATEIYCDHPEEHNLEMGRPSGKQASPFCTGRFFIHRTQEESKALNNLSGPFILLSSSGMATGGRVLHHLWQRLSDPKTTVLFVGYQAQGTRGETLQQGSKDVKMFGQMVPVRAQNDRRFFGPCGSVGDIALARPFRTAAEKNIRNSRRVQSEHGLSRVDPRETQMACRDSKARRQSRPRLDMFAVLNRGRYPHTAVVFPVNMNHRYESD